MSVRYFKVTALVAVEQYDEDYCERHQDAVIGRSGIDAIEFNDGVLLLDLKETELMLAPMEGSK